MTDLKIKSEEKADGTIIQTSKAQSLDNTLRAYPNYVGYTTDMGNIKDGKNTGEKAVTIFVTKKVPLDDLSAEEILPQNIDGVMTDVVVMEQVIGPRPLPQAEAESLDDYKKDYKEPPCGVSWGNVKISAGTGGGPINIDGTLHLASNTHVGCESISKDLSDQCRDDLQPGNYDDGTKIKGYTAKAIVMPEGKPAFNDFCVIRPTEGVVLNPATLQNLVIPRGMTTLKIGDRVWKEGRTTGLTFGTITSLSSSVNVGYGEGTRLHLACILSTDMSAGGDSGSWIYKKVSPGDTITNEDKFVVAYLFAGSATHTVMHEIQNAVSAVGGSVYTEEPTPPIGNIHTIHIRMKEVGNGKKWIVNGDVVRDINNEPVIGATVNLDDVQVATDTGGDFQILEVSEGDHTIQVTKDGLAPYSETFTLPPQ